VIVGSADLGPLAGTGARAVALTNTDQFQRRRAHSRCKSRMAIGRSLTCSRWRPTSRRRHPAQALRLRTEFPQAVRPGGAPPRRWWRATRASRPCAQPQRLRYAPEPAGDAQPAAPAAKGPAALRAHSSSWTAGTRRWSSPTRSLTARPGKRLEWHRSRHRQRPLRARGRVKGGSWAAPRFDRLENGNLVHAVEFRSLYATVLERGGACRRADSRRPVRRSTC
jgi:hypothetical protein